jgi:hypothetical protein
MRRRVTYLVLACDGSEQVFREIQHLMLHTLKPLLQTLLHTQRSISQLRRWLVGATSQPARALAYHSRCDGGRRGGPGAGRGGSSGGKG